jgi:hypothetical protein
MIGRCRRHICKDMQQTLRHMRLSTAALQVRTSYLNTPSHLSPVSRVTTADMLAGLDQEGVIVDDRARVRLKRSGCVLYVAGAVAGLPFW